MATFVLYQPIPHDQIDKEAKELVQKSNDFFKANPKRRVAKVGVWYGKMAKIRKNHIQEDIDAAVALAKHK